VALDVTDAARCQQVVDDVVARHHRLDVLVNNAGLLPTWADRGRDVTNNRWR
jgi:NAD(P)-dependent dehydrogenase (short-subunit alcohol dehydrogenase family)